MKVQDLSKFKMPPNFRGRSGWYVQLWWMTQSTLFRWSPQIAYRFRASLLRLFGAKIGANTIIRPTATFTYPWKVSLGDRVWIGDDTVLYSLGDIHIGSDSVISQRSYLCAGDHNYKIDSFPIRSKPIYIGDECWIATDVFIAPGVRIPSKVVVGARSSVFSDLQEGMLYVGNPARPVKPRDS